MAEFSRKKLKEIFEAAEVEVPKDVLAQICSLHMDANEEVVADNKTLRADLKKVEKERDDYKAQVPEDGGETVSKKSYDELKKEFDTYKEDVESKESYSTKEKAFREFLKNDVKISEKRIERVLKVSKAEIEDLELDKDGNIKKADKLKDNLAEEWADFVETKESKGSDPSNPPGGKGGGKKLTKDEIIAIEDPSERRAAIAENLDLFE